MSEAGRIVRIAARGDGVTADGRFVASGVTGDLLHPDGRLERGPHHVAPACPHFGKCGGCQLQHADDIAYADYLTARIAEALGAQGLSAPEMRPPHLSPPQTRRRASLRAERKGRAVQLGFNEAGSHRIVDVTSCPVLHPALFTLLPPLRTLLANLLADRRSADVRMTLADQGIDLTLTGVSTEGLAAIEALNAFAMAHRLARLSIDEGYGPEPRWEPEPVTITLGGVAVPLPENVFLQATTDGEAALAAAARDAIGDARLIADLFSGLGTFALSLSGRVYAAEGARDAALSLQAAAKRVGGDMMVDHRDLFRRPLSAQELDRFQAVILDPPRAGAKEQVGTLALSKVPRIVYVSCNPATFARDAKALVEGGYRLDWIQPVGQFRWSTHVELAACFTQALPAS